MLRCAGNCGGVDWFEGAHGVVVDQLSKLGRQCLERKALSRAIARMAGARMAGRRLRASCRVRFRHDGTVVNVDSFRMSTPTIPNLSPELDTLFLCMMFACRIFRLFRDVVAFASPVSLTAKATTMMPRTHRPSRPKRADASGKIYDHLLLVKRMLTAETVSDDDFIRGTLHTAAYVRSGGALSPHL